MITIERKEEKEKETQGESVKWRKKAIKKDK